MHVHTVYSAVQHYLARWIICPAYLRLNTAESRSRQRRGEEGGGAKRKRKLANIMKRWMPRTDFKFLDLRPCKCRPSPSGLGQSVWHAFLTLCLRRSAPHESQCCYLHSGPAQCDHHVRRLICPSLSSFDSRSSFNSTGDSLSLPVSLSLYLSMRLCPAHVLQNDI